MDTLTRIRRWLKPDVVMVRFLNGPLGGQEIRVNRRYLTTGVDYNDEDRIYGPNGMSMHQGWGRALGYDWKFISRVHYDFHQLPDEAWYAVTDG